MRFRYTGSETIPAGTTILDCSFSPITKLPENLPNGILEIYLHWCSQFKALPDKLPESLRILNCQGSGLESLPENLPGSLESLYIDRTRVKVLPKNLPGSLKKLYCVGTQIRKFPTNILGCEIRH